MSSPIWKQRRGVVPSESIRATSVKWRGKPCACNRDGAPNNCPGWAKQRRKEMRAEGRWAAEARAKERRAAVRREMLAERWTKAEVRYAFGLYDRRRDGDSVRHFGERLSRHLRGKQAKRTRAGVGHV